MHCCYRFVVYGRVQGVFFRVSARDEARNLGLQGWVRNLQSGEVEVIACGDVGRIEGLKKWLHQGPQFAKVTDVKAEKLPDNHLANGSGFKIRRDG